MCGDSQALRSLARNKLTAQADSKFKKSFSKARKEYVADPTRARTCSRCFWLRVAVVFSPQCD